MLPSLLRESGTSKRRAQSFMVTSQESLVLRAAVSLGQTSRGKWFFYDKNWRVKVLEFLAIILRYTY